MGPAFARGPFFFAILQGVIIGITGTNGAGKGTVVDYLVKRKGFAHYSARDFIVEELLRRGMPVERNAMREVGNELREAHGPGYVVEELHKKAAQNGGNAVIESIRTAGEAEVIKEKGIVLWAVDADKRARYERSVLRGSSTDHVTLEQFIELEDREMQSDDPAKQNIHKVMQMADVVLTNDSTQDELFAQVEAALKQAGQ